MANSIKIPSELERALVKNKKANDAFQKLPSSHQREYVNWIAEAKKLESREARAHKCLDMLVPAK